MHIAPRIIPLGAMPCPLCRRARWLLCYRPYCIYNIILARDVADVELISLKVRSELRKQHRKFRALPTGEWSAASTMNLAKITTRQPSGPHQSADTADTLLRIRLILLLPGQDHPPRYGPAPICLPGSSTFRRDGSSGPARCIRDNSPRSFRAGSCTRSA